MPRKKTPAAAPEPDASAPPAPLASTSKLDVLTGLLTRPEGATAPQMVEATGWQAHSVRGAMSGALKSKRRLIITSEKADGGRVYRATTAQIAGGEEGGA